MLLEKFKNYLVSKNIDFDTINEEMIHFNANELDYVFQVDDRDKPYFRLIVPNLMEINDNNRNEIRDYIAVMNVEFKIGKMVEVEHSLWLTAEMFVYSFLGIEPMFERLIDMLHEFFNRIRQDFQNKNSTNNGRAEE
jgi:hypothetical protein